MSDTPVDNYSSTNEVLPLTIVVTVPPLSVCFNCCCFNMSLLHCPIVCVFQLLFFQYVIVTTAPLSVCFQLLLFQAVIVTLPHCLCVSTAAVSGCHCYTAPLSVCFSCCCFSMSLLHCPIVCVFQLLLFMSVIVPLSVCLSCCCLCLSLSHCLCVSAAVVYVCHCPIVCVSQLLLFMSVIVPLSVCLSCCCVGPSGVELPTSPYTSKDKGGLVNLPNRVGFKYVFVFEYQHFVYLNRKSQKGVYLIFGLYLKSICNYNQIHINITILPKKGKTLPDINWLRSHFMSMVCQLWAGRQQRKLAYSQAGQTLASMNEWEASEALP